MTDRELLELAAKAAGIVQTGYVSEGQYHHAALLYNNEDDCSVRWNPLIDDGDSLRLAASLKIDIEWQSTSPFPEDTVEAYRSNPEGEFFCATYPEDDYRRAITRAAAEIGKQK